MSTGMSILKHWPTTNLLSIFLSDLWQFWCAKSKYHIVFAQSCHFFLSYDRFHVLFLYIRIFNIYVRQNTLMYILEEKIVMISIRIDLKMVNFLLRQQSGFIKYLYFLRMWDSRGQAQLYTTDLYGRKWCLAEQERYKQPSRGERQNTLPTSAHQIRLD